MLLPVQLPLRLLYFLAPGMDSPPRDSVLGGEREFVLCGGD